MKLERRLPLVVVVVLGVVFGFGLYAQATTNDCDTYRNHNGHVPGSYDYGVFIEDGFDTLTVDTNGQNINIPPPDGRNSWDTVKKCHYPTTTTTTMVPETTTTAPTTTTTTPAPSSTTTTQETTTTSTTEPPTSTTSPTTSLPPASTTSTSSPATTTSAPSDPSTTTTTIDPPATTTTTIDFCAHDIQDGELVCLPFTGITDDWAVWLVVGVVLLVLGAGMLVVYREERE